MKKIKFWGRKYNYKDKPNKKEFESLSEKIVFNGLDKNVAKDWRKEDFAVIRRRDVREFIEWCETHSHMSEGVNVIDIEKLKEGAGKELVK